MVVAGKCCFEENMHPCSSTLAGMDRVHVLFELD